MFKTVLVVALAATFVAAPALARPWHGHRRRPHAAGHGARVHVHHPEVDDQAFLWLGLAALGIGTLYALSHPPRPEPARWRPAPLPRDPYRPRPLVYTDRPLTMLREGFDERGDFCREFHQDVRIGNRGERAWGTACLQEDRSWRITR